MSVWIFGPSELMNSAYRILNCLNIILLFMYFSTNYDWWRNFFIHIGIIGPLHNFLFAKGHSMPQMSHFMMKIIIATKLLIVFILCNKINFLKISDNIITLTVMSVFFKVAANTIQIIRLILKFVNDKHNLVKKLFSWFILNSLNSWTK